MSTSVLVWVVLLSSAGTFLIRFLPMFWRDKGARNAVWSTGPLRNGLNAVGPAAIVALLVAVTWSMISSSSFARDVVPVVAGFTGVFIGKWFLRGIAWATLAGVAAYGWALWLI